MAGGLSLIAGAMGAIRALQKVVSLPPAVAMQPDAPARFHRVLPARFATIKLVSQPTLIMMRHLSHHPLRAVFTLTGMALSPAIIIVSLFLIDTTEDLINVTFFVSDRQHTSLSFVEKRPQNVVEQVARLPGVVEVEPYREVPVRIRHGSVERRVTISGRSRDTDLRRVIDVNLHPVALPASGLAISAWLGRILGVDVGDFVEVDLLEGQRRTVLGSAPFAHIAIPYPYVMGPSSASCRRSVERLSLYGFLTRLTAVLLITIMIVAIASTKLPILLGHDFWIFHLPKLPRYNFWSMIYEVRADFDMLLGSLYLLIRGPVAWELCGKLGDDGLRRAAYRGW